MKWLIIVHGVNYFDEEKVIRDVSCQASAWGIDRDGIEAFNWDKIMGHPDDPTPDSGLNTRFISELGAGILESAHIGFFTRARNGQLPPRWFARLHSAFIFPLQLASWLLFPAVLVGFGVGHGWLVPACFAGYMILTTLLGTPLGITAGIRQCFRRSFLIGIWSLASGIMAPVVLPAATMEILVLIQWALFQWGRNWLTGLGFDTYRLSLANAALLLVPGISLVFGLIAMACLVLLIHLLRKTPLGMLIKISADACRYTGLAGYRSELLNRLHDKVQHAVAHQPAELLFLTHSLGSVIVTDYLPAYGLAIDSVPITIITMGSPLATLFPDFYPTEYPSPTKTFGRISTLVKHFRWINYYRKYDPIGGKLGDKAGPILDIVLRGPTQDAGRWTRLPAHADYWNHLNPQMASVLSSQPMFVSDGADPWQEPPADIPADPYDYGWNSHGRFAPAIWRMRRLLFGRLDKIKTRARDILTWLVLVIIALLADAASGQTSVFALKLFDYVGIVGLSIILFTPAWRILQPYLNLAFACFPYFQPPTARRQPLTWSATKKPLALTALFVVLVSVYIGILLIPVSSWKKIGSVRVNYGTYPGYYQTLATIGDHILLIGRYPGVDWNDVDTPRSSASPLLLPKSTPAVSYDAAAHCVAAANSESIAWGDPTNFPKHIRTAPSSILSNGVLSVGSDCQSMTVATDRALYFIDLKSEPSPKFTRMPVTSFASGPAHYLLTMVVSASGETIAFCGGDFLILRRKDRSAVRTGKCEVDAPYARISFSEEGNTVSWVENATTIGIADIDSGAVKHVVIDRRGGKNGYPMTSTALSRNGKFLAVGLPEELRIYDLTSRVKPTVVAVYEGDRNLMESSQIIFMASERFVTIADWCDGTVTVMRWSPPGIREKVMKLLVKLKIRPDESF